MQIQKVLVFIGAAALSMSACADPSIAPSLSGGNNGSAQVRSHLMYRLTKDEAVHMRGAYRLADGRTLTVTNRLSKLYADLDGKIEEMLPVGPTQFVTRDSGTRLAFNRVPFADEVVVDQAVR
jgi:hypothetical protein